MIIPWDKWEHLYLFPPTVMISKALAKLSETKFLTAILITKSPNQTMIHGSEPASHPILHDDSEAPTEGRQQNGDSSTAHHSSHLEVIRRIYEKRLPSCKEEITLIAEPIRKTSSANYQQKWQAFLDYITSKKHGPYES